jgi:hypothetical protein
MRIAVALLMLTSLSAAEEMTIQEAKNLSLERCLQLPAPEIVTRCPSLAGRIFEIGESRQALVDRVDQRKGTLLCEESGKSWQCKRIVVLEYETRGTRKRDAQKFITAAKVLERLATAPTVKLGEEFGALQVPPLPPKTCLDVEKRGCAVQAVRLHAKTPDQSGNPMVKRRLWLVEDADGTTLLCSDADLSRCDELTAAGWTVLALTLRPSSLAPPELAPEVDAPESRSDRRPGAVAEGAESGAGVVEGWIKPKADVALPKIPSRADVTKAAHTLEQAGRGCIPVEAAAVAVGVLFSGEGSLLNLTVDGAAANDPKIACLTAAAKKLSFPRFAGNTYQLQAVILPANPKALRQTPRGRRQR